MKKISLNGLTEVLSEKELKAVMAGSGVCDDSYCDRNKVCTTSTNKSGHCIVFVGTGHCVCGTP